MSETPPEERSCPRCGATIGDAAPGGLCPHCLMGQAGIGLGSSSGGELPLEIPGAAELDVLLEGYEVKRLIGRGGMGAVYEARQKTLDRPVAIKLLPAEVSGDEEFAERFTREARAMARLNHPNIVSVYDFGRSDAYVYFVMEFVEGEDLSTRMKRRERSPMAVDEAVRTVEQVCAALSYAHRCGVIHRDIKPANILVREDGVVKITDFGLAKVVAGEDGELLSLTLTEERMGTPQYSPPELLNGAGGADERSDLYSLAVVFYELLTGKLPVGKFRPASELARMPRRLDRVLSRGLASDPDERFRNGADFALALKRGRQGVPLWAAAAVIVVLSGLLVQQWLDGNGGAAEEGGERVSVAAEEQGIEDEVKRVRVVYEEVESMELVTGKVGYVTDVAGGPWGTIETGREPASKLARRVSAKAAGGGHGSGGWIMTTASDERGQLRFVLVAEGTLHWEDVERDAQGRVTAGEWRYYFGEDGVLAGAVVKYYSVADRAQIPDAAEAAKNHPHPVSVPAGERLVQALALLAEADDRDEAEVALGRALWAHRCSSDETAPRDRESYEALDVPIADQPGDLAVDDAALAALRGSGLVGDGAAEKLVVAEQLGKRDDGITEMVLVTEEGIGGGAGVRYFVELLRKPGESGWIVAWAGRQARVVAENGARPWLRVR